jgi:hypothetical protein
MSYSLLHWVRAEHAFLLHETSPSYINVFSLFLLIIHETRFRPFNKLEIQQNSEQCIDVNEDSTTVYMKSAASLGKLVVLLRCDVS